MKTMRKPAALLMALILVLSLAACGGTGAEEAPAAHPHGETEAAATAIPAPTAEPTPEPTPAPAPDPEPEAEGNALAGRWTATVDLNEQLMQAIDSGMDDTGFDGSLADYLEEPFTIPVHAEFKTNGSYRFYVDADELAASFALMKQAVKSFFTDLMLAAMKQAYAADGMDVSGIETVEDLEAAVGASMDSMMLSAYGMDQDGFIDLILGDEMLGEMAQSMDASGSYTIDGAAVTLEDNDNLRIRLIDSDSFELDGDVEDGELFFPLIFHRVK